ncbi:SH3 and PX domain-containing protein 2A-like isoform X2 [Mercenaria mercenaria]|uniref:SH3 and PX domain-containing protein 2A-like isoform X2 n=1 Tax=Mercenaria mercenaria TaxID=6596 RepID=UPI00234E5B7B|nr:SH3 and PX domain-containing protein 2A-like isoform X2 [Mercenaria mercenaria]
MSQLRRSVKSVMGVFQGRSSPKLERRKASVKAKKISQPKPLEVYVAVTDYKKQEKGEVTLKVGMLVEIVEKTETGWWFVNVEDEQGWVPSTCLEREDGLKEDSTVKFSPGEEQQYLCTEEFRGEGDDEISMERGAVVDVIEKNLEGWWLVRYNGQEGYVPATFLIQTESVKVLKKNKHEKVKNGKLKHERVKTGIVNSERKTNSGSESLGGGPQIVKSLMEVSDLLKDDSDTNTVPLSRPTITTSQIESDDDVFDDDDDYEVPEEEENYSVQELSKILREDKKGCAETNKVYESIQSMKSRSLKRYGSTRPPPRPSVRPSHGGFTPTTPRPALVHSESFSSEYFTIAAFSDAVGDGISFNEGQSVKVLEKSENGWWYIEIDDKEGWAPAAYIERVEPVKKARVPSPLAVNKTPSPSRSREDLTNDDTEVSKRSSTVGDLASAIKAKLNKGNKPPPTPPKKDFLNENDTKEDRSPSGHSEPGRLQIPGGFPLPGQLTGLKKAADRSSQPPPPAPPANRNMQPPPPAPPVKTTSEPKPAPFGAALKPTPPKKADTKLDNKPKPPSLPMKPLNEKSKPSVPLKHNSETVDSGPKPPVKPDGQVNAGNNESNGSVVGNTNALKAKFSAMDNEKAVPKPAEFKPTLPVKSKIGDAAPSERSSNVAGLTGALKAKFEGTCSEKTESEAQKSKPNVNPKVHLKPVHNQTKSGPPSPLKKPGFGSPGIPLKPGNASQAPQMPAKPSWVKKPEKQSPPTTNRPSWAKSNTEITKPRKSDSGEDDIGAHKVSDLANVLKAKFENRQTVGDSSGNEMSHRESKPLPPAKSAVKQFQKPARPATPPSPKTTLKVQKPPQGRQLPVAPVHRSSSPSATDSKGLDPQKYSSRPLPPQPKSPVEKDTTNKHPGKVVPSLPTKPKSASPIAHVKRADSRESTDSEDESKPVGVSNLANVLKARLGGIGAGRIESSSNTPSKSKENSKQTVFENHNSNSDIENNNVTCDISSGNNLYSAIADFAGHNEGEIRLSTGQQVELLETAEGWSYVSCGGSEGWAPSTYLEKVQAGQGGEQDSWTGSQSFSSKQTVFRTNTEFIAENEGELSVSAGQEVSVLENPDGGWWYIETAGSEGWIPASYIDEVTV